MNNGSKNHLVENNFTDVIILGKKFFQHKCNHCEHQFFKLEFRAQHHLKTCQTFQNHQKKNEKKKKIVVSKSNQIFITSMIRFFGHVYVVQFHRANAMAAYMTNFSFNHFESSYVIEFFKLLHFDYKFFNQSLIAERLLNETYETMKLQMMQRLNVCNYLNFFIDETINIRKKRIINLCCHLPSDGEFHIKITAEFADKIDAAVQIE